MEQAVAICAIINFTIMGISHIVQPQAWRDFFLALHSQGRPGAFANGLLTLVAGSFIVSFHNVWSGVPMILTLIGWGYLLKSTTIFVYPDWNLRSMASVQTAPKVKLFIAGLVLLSVAIALAIGIMNGSYDQPI